MKGLQDQYRNTSIETFGRELEMLFDNLMEKPITDFYSLCYNLDTATGVGLDLWGEILKFPRYIQKYIEDEEDKNSSESIAERETPLFKKLGDEEYRKILKIKALQRRGGVNIPELNEYMQYLFNEDGRAYIEDTKDMTFVTYVFEYEIKSWLWFVFNNYDILPHPSGVGMKIVEVIRWPFAFAGQAESNFYNVNFEKINNILQEDY